MRQNIAFFWEKHCFFRVGTLFVLRQNIASFLRVQGQDGTKGVVSIRDKKIFRWRNGGFSVKKTIFATLNKDESLKRWILYAHRMSGLVWAEAETLTP
ncbi:hypothetical protein [uncultured Mediterranea sp.]|uniref:hypothetical protein n=1 Tax=uncultured Mediterranea sp. TaxID=1926662 RepID=UPI002805A58C|nr:hypothetical protein [uncultured Mediterranea sp.]